MTTSKVFVIMTQVLMLCACSASNGGLGLDSSLSAYDEDDQNCILESTDLNPAVKNAAEEVCRRTNAARASQGLAPLVLRVDLSDVAQSHSQDMLDRNFFNHTNPDNETPFDRLRNAGITYQAAAENIASGQTSAEQVVTAWMNSSGHRANILNPRFTKLGVGVVGSLWTQVFTNE